MLKLLRGIAFVTGLAAPLVSACGGTVQTAPGGTPTSSGVTGESSTAATTERRSNTSTNTWTSSTQIPDECGPLAECCPVVVGRAIDAGLVPGVDAGGEASLCETLVARGNNAECAVELQTLQSQGVCGTPCEDCAAYCPSIAITMGVNFGEECFRIAAGLDVGMCANFLGTDDSCNGPCPTKRTGDGGAQCSSLAACCLVLPGGDVSACNEVSAAGSESACETYLKDFAQFDGYCKG